MKSKLLILTLCVSFSTSVPAATGDSKRYAIKWQERSNRILFDSVCYNYAEGSIPYRRCRAQAKKHFTQQCRLLSDKYSKTRSPYNQKYKVKRDKFCQAADRYYPL